MAEPLWLFLVDLSVDDAISARRNAAAFSRDAAYSRSAVRVFAPPTAYPASVPFRQFLIASFSSPKQQAAAPAVPNVESPGCPHTRPPLGHVTDWRRAPRFHETIKLVSTGLASPLNYAAIQSGNINIKGSCTRRQGWMSVTTPWFPKGEGREVFP